MRRVEAIEAVGVDGFEKPTEQDIIRLWQSFRSVGLSEGEAWDAILAGIALDLVFSRSRSLPRVVH